MFVSVALRVLKMGLNTSTRCIFPSVYGLRSLQSKINIERRRDRLEGFDASYLFRL